MKLSTRDAPGYFAKPDKTATGLLIYGQDAMRVALRRGTASASLIIVILLNALVALILSLIFPHL